MKNNVVIRYAESKDREFWRSLDSHISDAEFDKKVRDRQGYVILADVEPVGILRYNLFWDEAPFCTLLFIAESRRGCGFGKALIGFWENEMRERGHRWILTSTQSDESAQYFYRKLGYKDCGELFAPDQAAELFLSKNI